MFSKFSLYNIVTLRFFDETLDRTDGPLWAKAIFVIAMLVLLTGMVGVAYSGINSEAEYRSVCVALSGWSVLAGACWHVGMKGRAKNHLLIVFVLISLLSSS